MSFLILYFTPLFAKSLMLSKKSTRQKQKVLPQKRFNYDEKNPESQQSFDAMKQIIEESKNTQYGYVQYKQMPLSNSELLAPPIPTYYFEDQTPRVPEPNNRMDQFDHEYDPYVFSQNRRPVFLSQARYQGKQLTDRMGANNQTNINVGCLSTLNPKMFLDPSSADKIKADQQYIYMHSTGNPKHNLKTIYSNDKSLLLQQMKHDVHDLQLYMPPGQRDAYDEVDKMGNKKYKFERQTGRRTSTKLSLLAARERQCGCPKFYDKEFDDRSYRQSYAVLRNRVCHM